MAQVAGATGVGPKVTQAAATVFALPLLLHAENALEPVTSLVGSVLLSQNRSASSR